MGRLAAVTCETSKPDKKRDRLLGDGDGLFLRVRPHGTKTWVVEYVFKGTRTKYTIGVYDREGAAGESIGGYIVCLNENQAKKDAVDRAAIVAALSEQLKQGDKSLVGNRGYRKYLKTKGAHFEIDEEKLKAEARYDGKWVLRTNTTLSVEDVALKYKQLWQVEALFRTTKSLLETRPIFHQRDETIRGHIFCSFLALILRKALLDRLEAAGQSYEWAEVVSDLDALQEVEVEHQEKRFRLRTEARRTCGPVFRAVGVALPPTVQQIREVTQET